MFDPPFDVPPVLVALTVVAASSIGIATAIAPTPPSDASTLAATVDRVAASPIPTSDTQSTSGDAIRIESDRLTVRDDAGEHTAVYATGRVTPVEQESRLGSVLAGEQPDDVFRSPVDLEIAAKYARANPPGWQYEPARLRVRHVQWGEVDVTLVGV